MNKKDRPIMATSGEVIAALRARYPKESHAFLEQVGNATGAGTSRHCDAVAMSLWPSRGLEIIGFEVKVRRSDWLKELADPQKADAIARFCDCWYLVVGDESIVADGELPKGWGLMVPAGGGKLKIKASPTPTTPEPAPTRLFMAAVLRQAQAQITDRVALEREYQCGYNAGVKATNEARAGEVPILRADYEDLRKRVNEFENASGVRICERWQYPEKIGHAVRLIMNGDNRIEGIRGSLNRLLDSARHIESSIESELAALKTPAPPASQQATMPETEDALI